MPFCARNFATTLLVYLLALCVTSFAGPTYELVNGFKNPPSYPGTSALIAGPDGYYWGTSGLGGAAGVGTIYRIKPDGSDWEIFHSFGGRNSPEKGSFPSGGLLYDGSGWFWGTTSAGGVDDYGTVFKINSVTGEYVFLAEFTRNGPLKGRSPGESLVSDGKGFLWGTTNDQYSNGSIFKVNAGTGAVATVLEFDNTNIRALR